MQGPKRYLKEVIRVGFSGIAAAVVAHQAARARLVTSSPMPAFRFALGLL